MMITETVKMAATAMATLGESAWLADWAKRWDTLHAACVATGDKWLDHAAAMDLTSKTTTTDDVTVCTWNDEWNQFTTFGSWPGWEFYKQSTLEALADGWQGFQSVLFWFWLTVQPVLYSLTYLIWRLLQVSLGAFLPYFQWVFIEVCRFHLHLGWRQALGELVVVGTIYYSWRIVRHLRRKQYLRRTKRFIRGNWRRATRSIQRFYKEIAHVSLLLAMTIPHALYIGLVVMVKACYPSWVSRLSSDTVAPCLLKFWYPIIVTIAVLHRARAFFSSEYNTNGTGSDDGQSKHTLSPAKGRSVSQEIEEDKSAKRKAAKRRRRSSFSVLFRSTASVDTGAGDEVVYTDTEEELNEDIKYWLNYWLLYSTLKATYSLATKTYFISTLIVNPTVHSILCQLDFLFYIWIFCLPQCLLILFPSAGEEERRDWSKSKQWCYDCSLDPVVAIPEIFLPVLVPCFEKVSQAVKPEDWKKYVVDYVKQPLAMMTMLKMLSEERKDAILDHLSNFNTLVIPALTLVTPGFITQYGVWYVQFIVPQAHSCHALARERRRAQRILYLKFWVLHTFASFLIDWTHTLFWIFPLKTHLTFIAWCVLVMPRLISSIYDEFDRELQAFRLLPPVADGLSMENTHTARALSILYATLPKAEDVDRSLLEKQSDITDADKRCDDKTKTEQESNDAQSQDDKETTVDVDDMQVTGDETNDASDAPGKAVEDVAVMSEEKKDDAVEQDAFVEQDSKDKASEPKLTVSKSAEDKASEPNLTVSKSAEDEGEKENQVLSSNAKNIPLGREAGEDIKPPSSKSKHGKDAAAKQKNETGENLRRRSNRLKQSAN